MKDTFEILNYKGYIDHRQTDILLQSLKSEKEFLNLHKTIGKRVYAITAECLENIARYSPKEMINEISKKPFISITIQKDKIFVRSGNPLFEEKSDQLAKVLNKVNTLSSEALADLYEKNINREYLPEENGAGLGFIIMKLKSGNKLDFSFTNIRKGLVFFNIEISINKFIMRKLVIEKTSFSPGVILDPEKNIFVISGESRPPDVAKFYGEILSWFEDFSHSPYVTKDDVRSFVFDFDFEYFNSSSAKYLLDFCKQIAASRSAGMDIIVNWHYDENDLDMLEAGREMSRIAKLPFEFVRS